MQMGNFHRHLCSYSCDPAASVMCKHSGLFRRSFHLSITPPLFTARWMHSALIAERSRHRDADKRRPLPRTVIAWLPSPSHWTPPPQPPTPVTLNARLSVSPSLIVQDLTRAAGNIKRKTLFALTWYLVFKNPLVHVLILKHVHK